MNILTIGNSAQIEEITKKFGEAHEIIGATAVNDEMLRAADVIFDFNNPGADFSLYKNLKKPVFINTVFTTLQNLLVQNQLQSADSIFGFCGLHTFVNRDVLEVSISNRNSESDLKSICSQLGTDYAIIKDQIGFATPRVISMIINEAYITAEEGTASVADIDLAMKLGTNYPFGPFEWAKRIGLGEVIKLMDALYTSANDERYKACNSLRHAN